MRAGSESARTRRVTPVLPVCGLTALLSLWPALGVAADQPPPADTAQSSSTPVAAAPAPAPTDTTTDSSSSGTGASKVTKIDEIVVTAQKRKEKLQDVPLAVTVVNQAQLRAQNITQVSELSRAVPAIETNGEPGNPDTRISIRGISTNSFSVTAEQAVSYVADGVVLGKAPAVNLFDVSRIEVLRGPQGTLFGKNASAGVISVTTNAPDPSKFEVMGHADLGFEYGHRLLQAAVNLPISSDAALRISVGQSYEKGLIHNVPRNEDSTAWVNGARARFLWEPTPELSFNLIGDYEKSSTTQQLYILFSRYNDASTGQPVPIPGCGGTIASYDARTACGADPTYNKSGAWGLSAQIDYKFEDFTVTSITAGRRYTQNGVIDVDGLPGNYFGNGNTFDNKVISQELRIASPTGQQLEYVAGFFYSKSNVPNFLSQTIGGDTLASLASAVLPISPCTGLGICLKDTLSLYQPNEYVASLKSAALFGQATLRVTDKWRWIAGVRATRDDVGMSSTSYLGVSTNLAPILGIIAPPLAPLFHSATLATIPLNEPLNGADAVKNISWRGGMQYDITRHMMVYATASRGYKGPQIVFNPPNVVPGISTSGVSLPTPASISLVKPEYPMDYEAGVKTTLLRGAFAANFNLFHTTIKDFQSSVFTANGSIPNNIPHVLTQGAELDLFGFLAPGLILNGGFIYNRVTYPHGYLTGCSQVGPKCPNTTGALEDVGGTQLIAAPKFKFTLTPTYQRDLNQYMSAFISTDVVYKTDIRYEASTDTRDHTGNHAIVGMRIGLRDPDDKWGISFFGRNIFNAYNPAFLFSPYLFASATSPGIDTVGQAVSTESYRFFGISLDGRF